MYKTYFSSLVVCNCNVVYNSFKRINKAFEKKIVIQRMLHPKRELNEMTIGVCSLWLEESILACYKRSYLHIYKFWGKKEFCISVYDLKYYFKWSLTRNLANYGSFFFRHRIYSSLPNNKLQNYVIKLLYLLSLIFNFSSTIKVFLTYLVRFKFSPTTNRNTQITMAGLAPFGEMFNELNENLEPFS